MIAKINFREDFGWKAHICFVLTILGFSAEHVQNF